MTGAQMRGNHHVEDAQRLLDRTDRNAQSVPEERLVTVQAAQTSALLAIAFELRTRNMLEYMATKSELVVRGHWINDEDDDTLGHRLGAQPPVPQTEDGDQDEC